jgi:hypothetical protein
MFDINWIAPFFGTAFFSAAFSFIIKIILEKKINNHFNLEIERIRHEYEMEMEKLRNIMLLEDFTRKGLQERRFILYPKMIELIYRSRNMVREISDSKEPSPMLIEELIARQNELEENLFHYRMDLEKDHFFESIHKYKNNIKIIITFIKEINYYKSEKNQEKINELQDKIKTFYKIIDIQYNEIIKDLSNHIDQFQGSEQSAVQSSPS